MKKKTTNTDLKTAKKKDLNGSQMFEIDYSSSDHDHDDDLPSFFEELRKSK